MFERLHKNKDGKTEQQTVQDQSATPLWVNDKMTQLAGGDSLAVHTQYKSDHTRGGLVAGGRETQGTDCLLNVLQGDFSASHLTCSTAAPRPH